MVQEEEADKVVYSVCENVERSASKGKELRLRVGISSASPLPLAN